MAINSIPTNSNHTSTIVEDLPYILKASDFNFADANIGHTLQSVTITMPPSIGTLRLKGVNVAIDQVISVADINAGFLVFTPAANANGSNYANFEFKVSDGFDVSVSAANFRFDVTAANDAPSFASGTGKVTTALGNSTDSGKSVLVQANGKILIGGNSTSDNGLDFALVRYNSDGSLDTSFSNDGKLTTNLDGNYSIANSIALQADNKILLAGYTANGENYKLAITRYNSDGSLDSSFGLNGKLYSAIGIGNGGGWVSMQADNKILLGGYIYTENSMQFGLLRYNSDGTLDNSFSGDGIVETSLGGYDVPSSIVVQPDGKIVLAGSSGHKFALARYNVDGTLDTSFDGDGKTTTSISDGYVAAKGVALQADGKILLSGQSGSNFALVRYNANGSLDLTFDGDGILTTAIGPGTDRATSIAVQSDGKILVGGDSWINASSAFSLVRYNIDGSLDTSFDLDGKLKTSFDVSYDYADSVTVQADGKILLSGTSDFNGKYNFAMARYNSDGSLDTSFSQVNTLDNNPSYKGNSSPVVLDSNVSITDAELSLANNFNGSSLTLARKGGANAQDLFGASGNLHLSGGNIVVGAVNIGTYTNSSGSLSMSFNANANQALVNSAMQQITYANTSNLSGNAEVNWRFNDGSGADNATVQGSTIVSLISPNVAPVISGTTAGQATTDLRAIQAFKNINITDPDIGAMETATITIDNPLKGSFTSNSLALSGFHSNDGGITFVHDAASPAAIQVAIRALIFQPNPQRLAINASETTNLTITIRDEYDATSTNSTTSIISTGINSGPTNIILSDMDVSQSEGRNATVGLLSAIDRNVGDTHTFTLSQVNASNANGKFKIIGNQLQVINPSTMVEGNYQVVVTATDANGMSFTKKLSIHLEDDVAPQITSIQTLRSPRPTVTTGSYIVKFNEAVIGVSLDDFSLSSTNGATAHLSSITALSGNVYRVYIDQILGTGSLTLSLKAAGTGISDLFGNSLPAIPSAPKASLLSPTEEITIDFVATNDLLIGIQQHSSGFLL